MQIKKLARQRQFVTKDKSLIREILSPRNSALRHQSLAEATVRPGRATERHCHWTSEEIYFVLQGQGTMEIEGERRPVGAGAGVVILPGQRHHIANTGDVDLVFLCCCSPAYRDDDTTCYPTRKEEDADGDCGTD